MIRTLLFISASLIILAGCVATDWLRVVCWGLGVVVIKCIDYDRDITKL